MNNAMPPEPHTHDDAAWRLPHLDWAPKGDQTVSTRLLAAAKDQCQECLPGLMAEAAADGDTLAVVVLLADQLLRSPQARRVVPAPALQGVFDRIKRMGDPEKPTVVGMFRTLSDEQRRAVAEDCTQAVQGYIKGVYEEVDATLLKRQQRPWWLKHA
jgi:hypothetical protein